MTCRRFIRISLRVRDPDDPRLSAIERARAAAFDQGWKHYGAGAPADVITRDELPGYLAAQAAWNARHLAVNR